MLGFEECTSQPLQKGSFEPLLKCPGEVRASLAIRGRKGIFSIQAEEASSHTDNIIKK